MRVNKKIPLLLLIKIMKPEERHLFYFKVGVRYAALSTAGSVNWYHNAGYKGTPSMHRRSIGMRNLRELPFATRFKKKMTMANEN